MSDFKQMLSKIFDEHGHRGVELTMESLTNKFYDENFKINEDNDNLHMASFQNFLYFESATEVIDLFLENIKHFPDFDSDLNKENILNHVIDYTLSETRKSLMLNWSDKIVFNIFDLYLKTEDPEGYNNIIETFLPRLQRYTYPHDIQITSQETIDAIFSTDLDYFLKEDDRVIFEFLRGKINEEPSKLLIQCEEVKDRKLTEYEMLAALHFISKEEMGEKEKHFIQEEFFKIMETIFSKDEDNIFSNFKYQDGGLFEINEIVNIEQIIFNQNSDHYVYEIVEEIKQLDRNYYQHLMNDFKQKYGNIYVDNLRVKNHCETSGSYDDKDLKIIKMKEIIDEKVQDFLKKQNKNSFLN